MGTLKAMPKAARRTVPVDLRDDFGGALREAGFESSVRSVFLIEGLLVYLPDETAVLRILRHVAGLAAPGSSVALDLAGLSLLQSPWLQPMLERLTARGAPWTYGFFRVSSGSINPRFSW